jgi:hypothetical protein
VDCYESVISAPTLFETCPAEGLTYVANILNNGDLPSDYSLSISGCPAHLGSDTIHLGPGESVDVPITLIEKGECDLTLGIRGAHDSNSARTHTIVMDCYGVDLEVLPSKTSACRGEPVNYILVITNTGYYADTYDLSLDGINIAVKPDRVSLESEQSSQAGFQITGTWCLTEDVYFTATAAGHASDTEEQTLELLTSGQFCAELELSPKSNPQNIECEGGAYEFFVKNTGYVPQEITLLVAGLEDYVIQPDEITLKPFESRPAALYVFGEGGKNLNLTIIATSEDRNAYLDVALDLEGPICGASRSVLEVFEPEPPVFEEETPTAAVVAGDEDNLLLVTVLLAGLIVTVFLIITIRSFSQPEEQDFFPEAADYALSETTDLTYDADSRTFTKEDSRLPRVLESERLAVIKEAISKSEK